MRQKLAGRIYSAATLRNKCAEHKNLRSYTLGILIISWINNQNCTNQKRVKTAFIAN